VAARQPERGESASGDREAGPLAAAEVKAEEALGDNGEEHEPAGKNRLHDREGRERERAHVQQPRAQRDEPADRPPARAKQVGGATQRVAAADGRCRHRPTLLEQESGVRGERRRHREKKTKKHDPLHRVGPWLWRLGDHPGYRGVN